MKRWLWAPLFGFRGLFQMRPFRHVQVLAGAGVGGGSLTYANTLPIPKRGFFSNPQWAHLADWESELAPHYKTARKMLGAAPTTATRCARCKVGATSAATRSSSKPGA